MRTYRNPVPFYQLSEQSSPQSVNLGAAAVKSQSIIPNKALGKAIVGVHINLAFAMTQSGQVAWNPSSLLAGLTISKGTTEKVKLSSYTDLERFFNMLTGLTDSNTTYLNDLQSAGAAGASSSTLDVFLPIQFSTEIPIQFKFEFNAYTAITNGTAGSVTITIDFYYADMYVRDDWLKIITSPTAMVSGNEFDASQYFNEAAVIKDVFLYVGTGADTGITSQLFKVGSTTIFETQSGFELRAQTTIAAWMGSLAGFLGLQVQPTAYPAAGSPAAGAAKPQILVTLGGNYTPVYYLMLQS